MSFTKIVSISWEWPRGEGWWQSCVYDMYFLMQWMSKLIQIGGAVPKVLPYSPVKRILRNSCTIIIIIGSISTAVLLVHSPPCVNVLHSTSS